MAEKTETHPVTNMSEIVSILENFSSEYSKNDVNKDNLRDRAIYFARRLFKGLSVFDSTMDKQFERFSFEDYIVIEKILTFSFGVFNLSEKNFEIDICQDIKEKSSLSKKVSNPKNKKRKNDEIDDITSNLDNLAIVEVIEEPTHCDYTFTKGSNKGKECGVKLSSGNSKCAKHSK